MFRLSRFASLWLVCGVLAAPLAAQPAGASGPPAWQDGASVYLSMNGHAAGHANAVQQPAVAHGAAQSSAATSERARDASILPAAHSVSAESVDGADERRLKPPSPAASTSLSRTMGEIDPAASDPRRALHLGLPVNSIYTMLSALAIVVGAFLLCAWLTKRSGARNAATMLPAEVVSVLGRVPLAARQFADLLRVGNKLVLIALTPTGAQTLTEVTDPVEVDRLVGLCRQSDPHSTTKAFEQVFRQMSREPAQGGFLGSDPSLTSLQSTMETLRAQRGEAARA